MDGHVDVHAGEGGAQVDDGLPGSGMTPAIHEVFAVQLADDKSAGLYFWGFKSFSA